MLNMKLSLEITKNTFFSLIYYLAPRFANVIMFVFLGRVLGPTEAGTFTLALTYLLIFSTFMRGLDDLVVRQVAREPDLSLAYFMNFTIVRVGVSVVMYAVLRLTIILFFDYTTEINAIIFAFSLSIFPDSLSQVAQAVFLGNKQFETPAIILVVVNILKLSIGVYLVVVGKSLFYVAAVWFLSSGLGVLLLFAFAVYELKSAIMWNKLTWMPLTTHWKTAIPFFLLTTLTAINGQTDTILLSKFHDESIVGLYGAATTIIATLAVASQAYRTAIYPVMARYALENLEHLESLYVKSMHYLSLMVFPISGLVVFFSSRIIEMIFGVAFLPAGQALAILAVGLGFLFLNVPNTRIMLALNKQNLILKFLVISVLFNIGANLLLDRAFGIVGASIGKVGATLVFFGLNQFYISKSLINVNIMPMLVKSLIASIVMVQFLVIGSQFLGVGTVFISVLIYFIVAWLLGHWQQVKIFCVMSN